jgi:hypothetical protein
MTEVVLTDREELVLAKAVDAPNKIEAENVLKENGVTGITAKEIGAGKFGEGGLSAGVFSKNVQDIVVAGGMQSIKTSVFTNSKEWSALKKDLDDVIKVFFRAVPGQAEDFLNYVEDLKQRGVVKGPVPLVGFSLGAVVVSYAMAKHPEQFTKMALIDDIDNQGYLKNLGWPAAEDALVAIDINNDGIISQAKEIAFKLWHEKAETDLDGLRLGFDKNLDGAIDSKDPDFEKLLVWQDRNQNGISEPNELRSFKDVDIDAILLNEAVPISASQEVSGNMVLGAVKISSSRGLGYLYDVALKSSNAGINYEKDYGSIVLRYPHDKEIALGYGKMLSYKSP